ncbi:MAG: sodium:proton antiporter [Kiritimatiellia bacterium]|nr:sodium:proton antiporter [Kiritimatiellia bacterium]
MSPACHSETLATLSSGDFGSLLSLWSALPFAGLLLSLALLPLIAHRFWQRNYPFVVMFWGLVIAIPLIWLFGKSAMTEIAHLILLDYIPFMILLLSLFTVAGGIYIKGAFKGTPLTNLFLLLIGTIIASWIGTTGASMLLIRPVIRSNAARKSKVHIIVFFIFLVSNVGGSLTPLGDPPLFLGFLRGVPFFWTFNLLPITLFVGIYLLVLFFLLDMFYYLRDKHHLLPPGEQNIQAAISLHGGHNFIYLGGIIAAVLFSGAVDLGQIVVFNTSLKLQNIVRDTLLVGFTLLSLRTTRKYIRTENHFHWGPMKEVMIVFAAIFITILPVLIMLRAGPDGKLAFIINAAREPWHFFWITGLLSSFLDNAPTYLTFLTTALGPFLNGLSEHEAVIKLIAEQPIILQAISAGAVFMGANTYIGNAPNFMVRAIAEENNVKMPSFFGFMAYSFVILIPIFILATLMFFI